MGQDGPTGIPREIRWSGAAEVALLLSVTALGAWLRFRLLGDKTIWLDEAFGIWVAKQRLPDLLRFVATVDHHPPLSYLLQHSWQAALGDSAAAVRSLPALLSVATIPLFYAAGRRLAGIPVALAATLLLAVSPFHIRYGQEARMYALMAFLAAAALYCLAVYLTASQPGSGRRRAAMAGLAVVQGLLMLTHNTAAVLFPLALNAGVAAEWARLRRAGASGENLQAVTVSAAKGLVGEPDASLALGMTNRPLCCMHPSGGRDSVARALEEERFWRGWVTVQAAALLIWLPWGPAFVRQAQTVYRDFWIQPPTGYGVWLAFHNFNLAFPEGWFPGSPWWDFLYWGLAALGLWALWKRGAGAALLAALFLLPAVMELAVSMWRPVFSDRTLIWTTLPYYLFVGAGLARLCEGRWPERGPSRWPGRWVAGGAALLLLGLSAYSLQAYYDGYDKEDWLGAAQFVASQAKEGDLVIVSAPWVQIPFDYYYPERAPALVRRGAPADVFATGELEPAMDAEDLPALSALIGDRATVWLVYSHEWYSDAGGLVPQELERIMGPPEDGGAREFLGVRVYRYAR